MSIIETIINEFCGIPGLKLNLISPISFELIDSSASDDNKFKNVLIKVIENGSGVQVGLLIWSNHLLSSGKLSDEYVPNTLLTAYIESIIHAYNSVYTETKSFINPGTYNPSPAIINAAIKLDLVTIGNRYLETEYTLRSDNIKFNGKLLANDILSKVDNCAKTELDYQATKAMYDTMVSDYAEKTIKSELLEKVASKLSPSAIMSLDLNSSEAEILNKFITKNDEDIQLSFNLTTPPKPNPNKEFVEFIKKNIDEIKDEDIYYG